MLSRREELNEKEWRTGKGERGETPLIIPIPAIFNFWLNFWGKH